MNEKYREVIGIPNKHSLVETETKWEQRKGQDTDTYWFNEVDEEGKVVGKYILKDSTSIYPPFKRNISYEKLD